MARGRGGVKNLDSVAGGSCSKSSKDGLIDTFLEQIFSIGNSRRITKTSDVVKVLHKTCLVSEQRVYSSVPGEERWV